MRKENKSSVFQTLGKLRPYVKEHRFDAYMTWIMVLLESVCEVLVAYFMQFLIDSVKAGDGDAIIRFAIIIASMAMVAALTGIMAGYYSASAAAGFGKNMREAMFVKIQDFSFENIDKFSTSSIVTRTTTDVTNVQNAFLMIIRAVIRAPFMMIFSLTMCFVTRWQLAWIYLIIVPFVFAALIVIASLAHPTFVKIFEKYDVLNEEVQENVDGMRVVKSFNLQKKENEKFRKISDFIYRNFVKAERLLAFNGPSLNLAVYGATIAIAIFGATTIVNSGGTEMSVGALSTMITYTMMIMMSLMMVSMVYVMIIIARNSAERIVELVDEKPAIVSPENPVTEIKDGSVEFKNVNFAYNADKYVLKNVNLSFKSGTTVGIIGSTGSSKTTLISLIARLYDVKEGEVKVGGVNVKEYDLTVLRDNVAVVLQKNTLFTGTIKENLMWGNENATEEELWHATDIAQASEFIRSFPDGMNTMIVEGGGNVSGGQKQRLCIARALLKNPKILILDDTTSACDTATDAMIRKQLAAVRPDITKFIISQRILSIKDCDEILVMNEGEVIGRGTDAELRKNCDVYQELVVSQMKGGDFDAAE